MEHKKNQPKASFRNNGNSEGDNYKSKEIYFDTHSESKYFRDHESEINLESLISTPMRGISKANSSMLSGQVDFIMEYCFEKKTEEYNNKSSTYYEAKMVNLRMQRGEESAIIPIPLITLLPINALSIEKMKVEFGMDVTSISSYKSDEETSSNKKAQINGKLGGNRGKKEVQEDNHLKISIETNQLPLSKGILNIIDLYSKIS